MQNKNKTLAILTVISLGFFICPPLCLAADQDIVITEIAAYPVSAEEWLEIFNKGQDPVDLTDWRFYEATTNHKLTSNQNDFIIEPGEYAIIANNADTFKQNFPTFTGTIFDSSWSSLNESGEVIGLKNSLLETIEQFTYLACPDTSLQRLDPNLNDYSENNWQVHATANSAGTANEFPDFNQPPPDTDPDPEPPQEADETVTVQRIISGSVLINEFVADGETEWLELYNLNAYSIDLTGWQVIDGSGTATTLEGQIQTTANNPFFVLESPKGKLNNSGDAIILKDKSNNIIDAIYYGDWDHPDKTQNCRAPLKNLSSARIIDGANTNNNLADFSLTQTPTKGQPNKIILPENDTPATKTEAENTITTKSSSQENPRIILSELFPNPFESDLANEFIELHNLEPVAIDLLNWQLQDNSERIYIINQKDFPETKIPANGYFTITRQISGLALNNDKETVKLINPANKTVDTAKYNEDEIIAENISYSLSPQNKWLWTTTATKNQENIITPVNHAPIIELLCPSQIKLNEQIICDASDSYDLENNPLTFTWEVDNQLFNGPRLEYLITQANDLEITLHLCDGQKTTLTTKKLKIIAPPKIVKPTTTAKTTVKTTASKTPAIIRADLNEVKTLATGTNVKTSGVVSVLPNTFGKTIMYVAGSGIQLYMSKSDWPNLKIGDVIDITGTLSVNQGEKRIKLAQQTDIKIIASENPPEAKAIKAEEINPDLVGYLVQISGQLIEKNGLNFYLQDETGEANVYIKTATQINKSDYAEGDNLQITGVLSQTNDSFKILPRFSADLVKQYLAPVSTALAAENEIPPGKQNKTITKYLIAAFIALLILTGLVLYKNYSQKSSK